MRFIEVGITERGVANDQTGLWNVQRLLVTAEGALLQVLAFIVI